MIVWGGSWTNVGGKYDPVNDTWTATSTSGAPSPRSDHTAVFTGRQMLVWGGDDGSYSKGGGAYCACDASLHYADADGDGYGNPGAVVSSCARPPGYVDNPDDCDDSDAGMWRTPGEVPDLAVDEDGLLRWAPASDLGGTSVLYNVLRTEVPFEFVSAAICVGSDLASLSIGDAAHPAEGSAFFYLVRAENRCRKDRARSEAHRTELRAPDAVVHDGPGATPADDIHRSSH